MWASSLAEEFYNRYGSQGNLIQQECSCKTAISVNNKWPCDKHAFFKFVVFFFRSDCLPKIINLVIENSYSSLQKNKELATI